MRPGALDRLGLNYDDITARNPAWSTRTPRASAATPPQAGNAAYDETVQAASGLVDIANRALGKPVYLPTILGDKVSSLTIAYSRAGRAAAPATRPARASTSRSR